MGWHGTIGGFVGIITFIKALNFCIRLKLLDNPVIILWIILEGHQIRSV